MTFGLKTVFVASLALGSLGLAGAASAMPGNGLQNALATSSDVAPKVEDVRLICPPFRPCFYAPGGYYRPYRPYGFYRPYGYHPYYRRRFFY